MSAVATTIVSVADPDGRGDIPVGAVGSVVGWREARDTDGILRALVRFDQVTKGVTHSRFVNVPVSDFTIKPSEPS